MQGARWRLAALWWSQVARIAADHSLRLFVVLKLAEAGAAQRESAWHWTVAMFVLPSIVLAPAYGALSNALPKRRVLIGAAGWCLAVMVVFSIWQGHWLWCLALVAVGSALYMPTRYALLPAAGLDTHWPLPRINGFIEMGTMMAIVGGMVLTGYCYDRSWTDFLDSPHSFLLSLQHAQLPVAVGASLVLSLLAFLIAIPVGFRSDVHRPEAPLASLRGFFRDSRRVFHQSAARNGLLALACFRGLVVAVTGAFIANALDNLDDSRFMIQVAIWLALGMAAGSLLAGMQGHPFRSLGLVPFGITGLTAVLLVAAVWGINDWISLMVGLMGGFITVPLGAYYQANVPADARGNAMAVLNTAGYVVMTLMSLLMAGLARGQILSAPGQIWFLAGLMGLAALMAWWALIRPAVELLTDIFLAPLYRIHAHGPGLEHFPAQGPVILIANHSSWLDPLWLGKVTPRPVTPMMTSEFYDLPVIHWLMKRVVGTIRVPDVTFRRDAPELDEAVTALDRGQCLMIFPEGHLRRREDQPLSQFGQGIWRILKQRPDTPVIACWIEGGWGSFFSRFAGPPTVNKRMDWWRRIEISFGPAQVLDPALLAYQRATRAFLMEACLRARDGLESEARV